MPRRWSAGGLPILEPQEYLSAPGEPISCSRGLPCTEGGKPPRLGCLTRRKNWASAEGGHDW